MAALCGGHRAETGRKRKYYGLTPQGEAQLVEQRRQWLAVDATLRGIWQSLSLPAPAPANQPTSTSLLPQGA